jgi:hypothetical protein
MWRLVNDSERGDLIMPENNVLLIKQNKQTNVQINLNKNERGEESFTGERDENVNKEKEE